MPFVPILWALLAGGASYAGVKLAENEPEPETVEHVKVPVGSVAGGVTAGHLAAGAMIAGAGLALLLKKG